MANNVHGRFGGDEHFQLIQETLHKLVNRYYEKNSRLVVENEALEFRSSISGWRGAWNTREIHPDVAMTTEPGEAGMETKKKILVECETRTDGLLSNGPRMAAYQFLREGNTDRNELMVYLVFPERLKGEVAKPEWANDLWFFEVGREA